MTEKNKDAANFEKMIRFESPAWIPAEIRLLPATWFRYGGALEEIVLSHPALFPNYKQGDYTRIELSTSYRAGTWVDIFGTTWENIQEGLEANPQLESAPFQNWEDWDAFELPDPLQVDLFGEAIDWDERKARVDQAQARGDLAAGMLWHGAMYMRLYYLRGYENFMIDVATQEPRLIDLINGILHFNTCLIKKWIEIGVDFFDFADDLGIQKGLPISPRAWRQYLKPCFAQMFGLCRDHDVYVALHTDGHILDIIPDLIDCGVQLLNPQVGPNTLEGLARTCKGRVALKLDLDRQMIPFATSHQVRDHIHQAVDLLAQPEGGFMFYAGCSYDFPLKNIETIFATLQDLGCRSYIPGER
jgi:hypothetical protein